MQPPVISAPAPPPPAAPQYTQNTSYVPAINGNGDMSLFVSTEPTTYRPDIKSTNVPQLRGERRQGSIKEPECFSCERGSAMRQAPAKFMVNSAGITVRVNLLFDVRNCCGPSNGLIDDIPQGIAVVASLKSNAVLITYLFNLPEPSNRPLLSPSLFPPFPSPQNSSQTGWRGTKVWNPLRFCHVCLSFFLSTK